MRKLSKNGSLYETRLLDSSLLFVICYFKITNDSRLSKYYIAQAPSLLDAGVKAGDLYVIAVIIGGDFDNPEQAKGMVAESDGLKNARIITVGDSDKNVLEEAAALDQRV